MSASNKVRTNIEIGKTELEARMNMRLDEFKIEIKDDNPKKFRSLGMKLSLQKTFSFL